MRDRGAGQEERHRREPENPLRHASPPIWFVCGTPTVRSGSLMRQQACQGLRSKIFATVRFLDSTACVTLTPEVVVFTLCAQSSRACGKVVRAAGRRERAWREGPMAKLTRDDVLKKAEELKNWGKWGPDDELGVLNYVTPEDIVNAARLVKKGRVFRLGLNLDENGPQRGIFGGRWNPMHQMLATGTDAVAGKHDVTPGLRRADFVIVRTGQMEDRLARNDWGGYAGGDAPGLAFETLDWIHAKQIAAICSDTWGIEVRPNATGPDVFQPWHWVTIPAIGIVHGEIFYLKELAEDCAADRVYEFFLCAPPLVITRGTGSPINPQAIK